MGQKRVKEKHGFDPYPGTLNLKIDKNNQKVLTEIKKKGGIDIVSPSKNFCNSNSYRVALGGIEAAIIVPCVPDYPEDIIEIMAPVNIKEKLHVKDGDELEIILKGK